MTPRDEGRQRELAVLGFLIAVGREPGAAETAADCFAVCAPPDFAHADTRSVAEVCAELAASGRPPDLLTVTNELAARGRLAALGGAGAVSDMAAAFGHVLLGRLSLLREAAVIASDSRVRALRPQLASLLRRAETGGCPTDLLAEELRAAALALEAGERGECAGLDAELDAYLAGLDPALRRPPVATPWRGVNAILRGGILPGELAVLAARPSVGKSAWALNVAYAVACSGKTVLFQSLEMPREQLFDRLAACVGDLDLGSFRSGLSPLERERAARAVAAMRGKPLAVFDDTRVTTADIRRRARALRRGGRPLGLVVVDYLQLLTPAERLPSREREVAEMTRALKLMAKDLAAPVLLLAQLNRKSEEAAREPLLSDLRESGAIEQDADIVIFLHQARRNWNEDEPVRVIVAKGRSSGVGCEHLRFQRRRQRFLDSDATAYRTAALEEEHATRPNWEPPPDDLG